MWWDRLLADLVVIVHAGYVGFVVLGQAAILVGLALGKSWARNPAFRLLHLAAIGAVVAQEFIGNTCPLTSLENHFRRRAGEATYPGAFLGYWVHELIFVDAPTWAFTVVYIAFGLVVAATFALAPPRRPGRRSTGG